MQPYECVAYTHSKGRYLAVTSAKARLTTGPGSACRRDRATTPSKLSAYSSAGCGMACERLRIGWDGDHESASQLDQSQAQNALPISLWLVARGRRDSGARASPALLHLCFVIHSGSLSLVSLAHHLFFNLLPNGERHAPYGRQSEKFPRTLPRSTVCLRDNCAWVEVGEVVLWMLHTNYSSLGRLDSGFSCFNLQDNVGTVSLTQYKGADLVSPFDSTVDASHRRSSHTHLESSELAVDRTLRGIKRLQWYGVIERVTDHA